MPDFHRAIQLIEEFKDGKYLYGHGILNRVGEITSGISKTAVLFRGTFPGSDVYVGVISESLKKSGVRLLEIEKGSRPNAPKEDLLRITGILERLKPGLAISFGGGSTIDAVKAAAVLYTLRGKIDDYFGTGLVTAALRKKSKDILPHMAIQTLASSAAHLTKYSNITDMSVFQKKLVVDEAIVPCFSFFDYSVTCNSPVTATSDGAFDGLSHLIEVLYGSEGKPYFKKAAAIASEGIELIIRHLPEIITGYPGNRVSRDALCYGTDLGGYAIMTGGTNGGHLTSFSFVDILSHGRACAIMNPYYTVFFAPSIEKSLKLLGEIFRKYGYAGADINTAAGRQLGIKVARAMFAFAQKAGFPTTLQEIKGFTRAHIDRALSAAKDPQLQLKLRNMPVPLTADMVDEYMGPVLNAAVDGNLNTIINVK